ncbi:MAG: glycosyltransferase family 4 protein [Alphaproteobacteria bacterium]
MRVAFYAPLKPPGHATPSGDRRVARLLIAALRQAGHPVEIASRFRSLDIAGDAGRQRRLERRGRRLAERLIERYLRASKDARPDLWFTYHLYYKAPDWMGPAVAKALDIPYVLAEASYAPKRRGGAWALGHEAVAGALRRAACIFNLNPDDGACIAPLLGPGARQIALDPFLDPAPYREAAARRPAHRAALARRLDLDPEVPWLLCVAMMREGDKAASYRLLAAALQQLAGQPWQLVVVGDGQSRAEIETRLEKAAPGKHRFTGALAGEDLPAIYASCDLFVWPAINEAFGMAILEAQAAGLPVLAGAGPGVARILADGETGRLVEAGSAGRFAEAVAELLENDDERAAMGAGARKRVASRHTIEIAGATLDRALLQIGHKDDRS